MAIISKTYLSHRAEVVFDGHQYQLNTPALVGKQCIRSMQSDRGHLCRFLQDTH